MKRIGFVGLTATLLAVSTLSAQVPTFDLGFTCAAGAEGRPDTDYSATVDCVLTSGAGETGAQGWSISLAGEGLSVDSITTAGTVGARTTDDPPGLRDGGFEKSETTAGEGNEGAVSAVVLSFTLPITLDTDSATTIAKIDVSGTFGSEEGDTVDGRLFYVDGRQGAGQPVVNNITHEGNTVSPTLGECTTVLTTVLPPPSCPDLEAVGAQVIIQTENVGESSELAAGGAETPNGTGEPAEVIVAPGESTVYAGIVSTFGEGGVQGWSLSVAVGGLTLVDVTTAGTVGARTTDDPPGLRDGGFEKTEMVDPALNGQGDGAVSAVVLSFTLPLTLAPTGTATVLAITVSGDLGDSGTIGWKDGLQGAGQPVANVATVGGETVEYICCQAANILVDAPPTKFVSYGDSNDDGRLDLADAIWLVNMLFRGGDSTSCVQSSDANRDGTVDLSDATFIVTYLFSGGDAPAGAMGCVEEDPENVDCEEDSSSCEA